MSKRHAVHRLIIFVTAAWRLCGRGAQLFSIALVAAAKIEVN